MAYCRKRAGKWVWRCFIVARKEKCAINWLANKGMVQTEKIVTIHDPTFKEIYKRLLKKKKITWVYSRGGIATLCYYFWKSSRGLHPRRVGQAWAPFEKFAQAQHITDFTPNRLCSLKKHHIFFYFFLFYRKYPHN